MNSVCVYVREKGEWMASVYVWACVRGKGKWMACVCV